MMSSRAEVGLALVGCGTIARFAHLRSICRLPGARLVAVVDPDDDAREAAARAAGASPFPTLEAALTHPEIEAVVVSSPTPLHSEHAVAACRAGRHVYVEKPLAADLDGGRCVVAAAREAGVTVAVGYNRRLHPAVRQARLALAEGRIGGVVAVRSTFCEPVPEGGLPGWKRVRRTGGGVLLDLASHHVDLIRWLLGREIATASAHLKNRSSEIDTAWVRWILDDGLVVQGFYAFGAGPLDQVELIGERGVLVIDRVRGTTTLATRRSRRYGLERERTLAGASGLPVRLRRLVQPAHDDSYRLALSAFVSVIAGRPTVGAAELATAEDGLHALEAVLLAEASCGF
jgi:predicted dehydrogenase